MPEIRDRVRAEMQGILLQYMSAIHAELIHSHDDVFLTNKILPIPELAIVDRDANLPVRFLHPDNKPNTSYRQAQQDMLDADWVKEAKDG